MPTTAIIQARMGSTRLPGKVLKPLAGHPMLWHVVQRVRATPGFSEVVVATSEAPADDAIRAFCAQVGVAVFSGSEEDVLDRYHRAAQSFDADPVIRVTSDCPLVDPPLMGRLLTLFEEGGHDYACIATGGLAQAFGLNGYPDGLDAECLSFAALERVWSEATEPSEREHVTLHLLRNQDVFGCDWLVPEDDWSGLRLMVDEPEDLAVVEQLFGLLFREGDTPFSFEDVLRVLAERPGLIELNRGLVGKEKSRGFWDAIAMRNGQAKETP